MWVPWQYFGERLHLIIKFSRWGTCLVCQEKRCHTSSVHRLLESQSHYSEEPLSNSLDHQSHRSTWICQNIHKVRPTCWVLQCLHHIGSQMENHLPHVLQFLWIPGHAHGTHQCSSHVPTLHERHFLRYVQHFHHHLLGWHFSLLIFSRRESGPRLTTCPHMTSGK